MYKKEIQDILDDIKRNIGDMEILSTSRDRLEHVIRGINELARLANLNEGKIEHDRNIYSDL